MHDQIIRAENQKFKEQWLLIFRQLCIALLRCETIEGDEKPVSFSIDDLME